MKIQELDALKRDMSVQLERLRVDEQYPFDYRSYSCMLCVCSYATVVQTVLP